jgi:uncharacterized protein YuzE
MKITYDSEADAMIIYLREGVKTVHSREIVPAKVIMSFDEDDNPIDIELLYISDYVADPTYADVIDLVQQALAAGKQS